MKVVKRYKFSVIRQINPGDTVILGIQWGLQLTILHSIFDIHYSLRE